MPIEYEGTLAEHRAVREAVGLFDLTHLGKIDVVGSGALGRLQATLSNDMSKVPVGGAQYNLVLTEEGGIVDDLIAYRVDQERWLVVPNAANTAEVLEAIGATDSEVEISHRPDLCTIAVQGPRSFDLVGELFPEAGELGYMAAAVGSWEGSETVLARSGYTGEPGFELFPVAETAVALWRELLRSGVGLGVTPCGLGARDTLRLEMGYPLHGNDISLERSPVDAGLGWAVALDKGPFRGRDAVVEARARGPSERLRGLRMTGRLIPRPHYGVYDGADRVGETTSGTFSPTLRVGIALAYLDARIEPGARLEVDVRGRRGEAEVVKPPFVDRSPKDKE